MTYANADDVDLVLRPYLDKLYIFIACADLSDRHLRDSVSITLVRVAQNGNILAKRKFMQLIWDTIADWIENHPSLSRWRGYEQEIQRQVEGCIRRYRYTGSFIRYLYRTLECAARGLRPLCPCSLDEPVPGGVRTILDLIAV